MQRALPILRMSHRSTVASLVLLVTMIVGMRPAHAVASGADVTRLFPLDGVAGFIEGRAQGLIAQRLIQDAPGWFAQAFQSHSVYEGVTTKVKVVLDIKQRMSSWAPSVSRQVLHEILFQNAITKEETAELEALSQSIEGALNTSLEGMLDSLAGTLYDQTATSESVAAFWPPSEAIIRQRLERYRSIAPTLSQLMGDATVAGIRSHVSSLMEGKLPEGALQALVRGDDIFPQVFSKLNQSVLMRPRVTLPSEAYAAILAASAAGHFANAFAGVFVNQYEIRRGLEVTRVMIWQLQKKDRVNVALLSFADIARNVAAQFGNEDMFREGMARIQKPMEQIQKLTGQLDQTIMGKWNDVTSDVWMRVKPTVEQLQQHLEEVRLAVGNPAQHVPVSLFTPNLPFREMLTQLPAGKGNSVQYLSNDAGELIGMQWFRGDGTERIREVAYRYHDHMLSVIVDSETPAPWLRDEFFPQVRSYPWLVPPR